MTGRGVRTSGGLAALALVAALSLPTGAAFARAMRLMESKPPPQAIIEGRHAAYSVRFDGPVDHRGSGLFITRDGKVVELLHPRLDAAPDVLFAAAPSLSPGPYELHWAAKSLPDGEVTEGALPFTVR
jgi:methionine-rich copper-binding protein CopC